MNKYYVFVLMIIFLVSCAQKEAYEKPEDLIEQDKMISILYDLSIFQSKVNHNKDPEMNKNVPAFLMKKYGVDSLRFVSSNRYYASQIEEYQWMYDEVLERIKIAIAEVEEADSKSE